MTKNELISDINFKQKCNEYGLYWGNAEIYDSVILINEGLYVIFDKNYNTIGIEKNINQDKEQFVNDFYKRYSIFTDIVSSGENFDYPFRNYTLRNFIDLTNRVDIVESNQGHSISTEINGDLYDRNSQENEEYFQLLSYIKFISEEIKLYFLMSYHMQAMGFEVPDIYSYVRALIKNVNASVDYQIKNNQIPWPADILTSIGQNSVKLNFSHMLYDIADLLMKQRGVEIKSDSSDTLEQLDLSEDKKDLSIISDELLRILYLSDEDLRIKEKNQRDELVQNKIKSIMPWINEDIDDDLENELVLKKVNKNSR